MLESCIYFKCCIEIDSNELGKKSNDFDIAWKLYENNFMIFDHFFIHTEKEEDLYVFGWVDDVMNKAK